MLKEALIIGGAGAAGTWISQKYGSSLEAQAAKFNVPPVLAHMLVVGGFTALSFFAVRAIL